jgi:hypothetical protein
MDSDALLPFSQAVCVARKFVDLNRQNLDQQKYVCIAQTKYLESIGLKLQGILHHDENSCTWKLGVVDARAWLMACVRYGF